MNIKLLPITALLIFTYQSQAREFTAEGSDLLMGVGPVQIARGGAAVASENGIYSVYWNPAGLADMNKNQISIAGQFNRKLAHINFAGAAFVLSGEENPHIKSVIGISYYPRLHLNANGKFNKNEFETNIVQSALPGMSGGFNGKVDSKTNDYRVGIGLRFKAFPRLSIGTSVGRVKCKTLFLGYENNNPAYIKRRINATALSIDIGAKYMITDDLTFGIVLKNNHSDLHVTNVKTDKSGTTTRTYTTPFLKDFAIGFDYRYSKNWDFAVSYQMLYGKYGSNSFDFQLLRFGSTYKTSSIDYHAGLIIPLKIKSNNITNIKLPAPALPTVGISYKYKNATITGVFYIHPIMTYATGTLKPALDISVSYSF